MLIVLADDFSGAAEIGGIAYRYGLNAEVQLNFNINTNADIVILDTDTRGLKEEDAIKKIEITASDLKKAGQSIQFKKVDSVFRGHLVPEINKLQQHFNYRRVLLLPANPQRGRKIIGGRYFVNDILLEKTVFAADPHFPATSSSIEKIIAKGKSFLAPIHITQNSDLLASGLITADVTSKEDIKNYIGNMDDNDLCCGAADCFEAYLENKGFTTKAMNTANQTLKWPSYTLIISGSTVKQQFEKEESKKIKLQEISLPGRWNKDQFVLEKAEENEWHIRVTEALHEHNVVFVTIDHEVKELPDSTALFSNYFVGLMQYTSESMGGENIHFALTGGATASGIIRSQGINCLKVKKEIAPGIVTLINEKTNELFTVKPGSYLWPASFIENLVK
jgi:uncharacterized protein YgbK (DUF1537 family)